MVRYSELSDEQKKELLLTPEEMLQLEEARKKPFVFDEDCPPVTPERAINFRRVNTEK